MEGGQPAADYLLHFYWEVLSQQGGGATDDAPVGGGGRGCGGEVKMVWGEGGGQHIMWSELNMVDSSWH